MNALPYIAGGLVGAVVVGVMIVGIFWIASKLEAHR